ncbi:SPFH domain-containing protein [[Eubacterium] cellulosolvens]
MDIGVILGFVILIIIFTQLIILATSVKVIQPYEKGLLMVLGKFRKILNPGLNIVPPIISKVVKIDMRVQTIVIPKQDITTGDGRSFDGEVTIYIKVVDPKKAHFNSPDYKKEIITFTQETLRAQVKRFKYAEILGFEV